MATTDQGPNMAPADVNQVVTTERNSVVIETPQPEQGDQAEPSSSDIDFRQLSDRLGNELGELRKQLRAANTKLAELQVPQADTEPATYADDPEGFIRQTIETTIQSQLAPKLQVLESDLLNRQSVAFDQKLSEVHPDWKEVVADKSFADWVQANPGRLQMYQIADKTFDADSGAELIRRFKQDSADAERDKQGAIGAAGLVQSSGDTGGARVYAASEIQHMIETDRPAYDRFMAGDGAKAYAEGRVDMNR